MHKSLIGAVVAVAALSGCASSSVATPGQVSPAQTRGPIEEIQPKSAHDLPTVKIDGKDILADKDWTKGNYSGCGSADLSLHGEIELPINVVSVVWDGLTADGHLWSVGVGYGKDDSTAHIGIGRVGEGSEYETDGSVPISPPVDNVYVYSGPIHRGMGIDQGSIHHLDLKIKCIP